MVTYDAITAFSTFGLFVVGIITLCVTACIAILKRKK